MMERINKIILAGLNNINEGQIIALGCTILTLGIYLIIGKTLLKTRNLKYIRHIKEPAQYFLDVPELKDKWDYIIKFLLTVIKFLGLGFLGYMAGGVIYYLGDCGLIIRICDYCVMLYYYANVLYKPQGQLFWGILMVWCTCEYSYTGYGEQVMTKKQIEQYTNNTRIYCLLTIILFLAITSSFGEFLLRYQPEGWANHELWGGWSHDNENGSITGEQIDKLNMYPDPEDVYKTSEEAMRRIEREDIYGKACDDEWEEKQEFKRRQAELTERISKGRVPSDFNMNEGIHTLWKKKTRF